MKHILAFFMLLSFMLASADTHAGPGRPNFSSRPWYSGFRSSSSPRYRSFSSSPSRSFTFRSTAPRNSAPAATSRSTYRSSSKTTNQKNNRSACRRNGQLCLLASKPSRHGQVHLFGQPVDTMMKISFRGFALRLLLVTVRRFPQPTPLGALLAHLFWKRREQIQLCLVVLLKWMLGLEQVVPCHKRIMKGREFMMTN